MSKQKNCGVCGGVLPASGVRSSAGGRGSNLRPPALIAISQSLLLKSSAALRSGLSLHEGKVSERIQAIRQLAGNDVCHFYGTKAEVNRMTHYAYRHDVRRCQLMLTSGLRSGSPLHPAV
jgi:hypothetical protein